MKKLSIILSVLLIVTSINAQTVTGKLVDQTGSGLADYELKLFINPKVYNAVSLTEGHFIFNNVTDGKDNQLPNGYLVSDNYPNPFNPKTRIIVTLPEDGTIKINIYNLLGQRVASEIERNFDIGTGFIDLELNGLPSGIYFARIAINEQYSVVRKMLLLNGSTHLSSDGFHNSASLDLNKTVLDYSSQQYTRIDSLVVTSSFIGEKTFKNLPILIGKYLDLGNLFLDRSCPGLPTITYGGKTYNTVQIGKQCWLKENLDIGNMVNPNYQQNGHNGIIEKACYGNDLNNCTKYGGLYKWAEALQYFGGASNSNLSSSGYQGHIQGVCPSGWHIPRLEEFEILADMVGYDGNALKEIWQSNAGNNIGNNSSGFSALLAGSVSSSPIYDYNGLNIAASFWSATESSSHTAYPMRLISLDRTLDSLIGFSTIRKHDLLSIRCLKDGIIPVIVPNPPKLLLPSNESTNQAISPSLNWVFNTQAKSHTLQISTSSNFSSYVYNNSGLTSFTQKINGLNSNTKYYWRVSASSSFGTSDWSEVWNFTTASVSKTGTPCTGTPTVYYSGITYNTVQIGNQCWMKENLYIGKMVPSNQPQINDGTIEKYCYHNDQYNCSVYGGLYRWDEAMGYSTTLGAQGICPSGWHIPTREEFEILAKSVNNNGNDLKAIGQGTGSGAGTDLSGFSMLLAGSLDKRGTFYSISEIGYLWSSFTAYANSDYSHLIYLNEGSSTITISNVGEKYGAYPVRCLRN
ncbi:T9SS C-terminal target domain-containing protein [Candidatus Parcubacteria bacterium]|jgi:uncharacterized protein (TIGR02145 family)|nr:MAG: T9SS C-terminal target domain-containing protein [Candidatus Parcubacteria bacterium]